MPGLDPPFANPLQDPAIAFTLGDALFVEAAGAMHRRLGRGIRVGLSGAQGSGKSTTAARLAGRLRAAGFNVAVLSLDDGYLTRAERRDMADGLHPLFATRGVPGTHDVPLLESTMTALLTAEAGARTPVPAFDKAADDRAPAAEWPLHEGRADIVLLEGWCVGARPQPPAALKEPVNALEREEDSDGQWRGHVNAALAGDYARLWASMDLMLMLRAPAFSCVQGWRAEQEAGLRRDRPGAARPMDEAALARFIAHYERLTRWLIEDAPADLIADIDETRRPVRWWFGQR